MADWQWQLGILGGSAAALVLGLALFAAWLVELRSIRGESDRRRRWALGALGGLGILAVYLLALQITLVRETFEDVAGGTGILLDSSRSMTLSGENGARSDAVRALIKQWQEDDRVSPTVYLFGSHPRAAIWTDLEQSYNPADDETKIREALNYVLGKGAAQELGALIIITDGADPSFRVPGLALGPEAPAIHAVVVGADNPLDDQAIVALHADTTAYVGVPALIRADVRAVGELRGSELRVQLWHESRLEQETVALLDETGSGTVSFEVTPNRTGRALYRLLIPAAASDQVPENNDRAALLRVGRERLRALLVAGRPTWDVRFLRDFLKRDGSVDLVSFFILRAAADLTAAPTNELALIPFPTDELFREHLGSFDVVIFQNFDYAPYEMQTYLPRIRDYVQRGGSFVMIGGDRSFSEGRYAGTAIEEILPVKLGGAGVLTGSFRAEVNKSLARHPIVALGPDPSLTRKTWQTLPPLHGMNMVTGIKDGAQVLLHHPRARLNGRARLPVLVVGEAGSGRVAAMTTDASWRWRFAADDATVGSDEYELFWDRMIRWLTRDPLLEPARISTDREHYGAGAEISVSGRFRDSGYRPMKKARVALHVQPDSGEGPPVIADADEDGVLQAILRAPTEQGAYEVVASVDGKDLAREVFIVERSGDELANLEAIPDRLQALAEKTGGRLFLGTEGVPPLSELASSSRRATGVVSKQPLLTPWFILLTILILGTTWVLRRRWGRR
ncbi:MAG TPA: glutamine amidotransferase [Polyangiales bacterium]|nr:glutamine amidotransferase [Polyangiales bacterium]